MARPQTESWGTALVSLDVAETPIAAVVAMLAAEGEVSVSIGSDVDGKITARFQQVPVLKALQEVAASVGGILVVKDGIGRIVKGQGAAGNYVRILRVGKRDVKQLADALSLVLGERGKVSSVGDALYVSSSSSLDGVVEWIEAALADPVAGWLLEVRVYELSRSSMNELGVDVNLSARASGTAGTAVSTVGAISASAEARLRSLSTRGRSRLVTEGTLWLLEGREGKLVQGESIPIPQRTVTDQGTVTVTGYSEVQTGFTVAARIDRHTDRAILTLRPELSSIVRLVNDEVPVIARRSIDAIAVVDSGAWLYVAGLEVENTRREGSGHLGILTGGSIGSDRTSVLVLVRASRVYDGS